jgi:fido (protein-threonine AMPylation protein)
MPSAYLIETAKRHIEGEITIGEVQALLDGYYKAKTVYAPRDRVEEADKISSRIVGRLFENAFTLSPVELIGIHRSLFEGIDRLAEGIRCYDFSDQPWAVSGALVYYENVDSIRETLHYLFAREKEFDFEGLNSRQTARHVAKFVSEVWQVQAFGDGNTLAIAIFTIMYLLYLGFNVEYDLFADHSYYFHNALVRANYNGKYSGVTATREYLDRFFGNLLFGETNELRNRDLRA